MASFKKSFFLIFLFLFVTLINGKAQQTIYLDNPSFEDIPRRGGDYYLPVKGWHDCGISLFPGETPPDVHPVPGNAWKVTMQAQDGKTFLGLVVRYNTTYETLSQKLASQLIKGKCYSLSVYLARSENYVSATMRSSIKKEVENFIKPVVFQIWGGDEFCEEKQLLAQSQPVENNDWELTELNFSPNENFKSITIVAFYADGSPEAYNGNLLVDNMSPIVEVDCD